MPAMVTALRLEIRRMMGGLNACKKARPEAAEEIDKSLQKLADIDTKLAQTASKMSEMKSRARNLVTEKHSTEFHEAMSKAGITAEKLREMMAKTTDKANGIKVAPGMKKNTERVP
jgi:methyl-accepting chemotaxis protein